MKHLTEEEMIEHYYSEDSHKVDAEIHLQACKQCAQAYEELGKLLGSIRVPEPPPRSSEYGAQVWQSIQGALRPYQPKRKRRFLLWPQLAYAAACLVFLAGAFWAGRMWEHAHTKTLQAGNPQQAKERVVLFVLDNHLDRSERLLVQLNHAGAEGENVDLPLQAEARQLLTDNRLYRQSVAQTDDPLLAAALDHLERVLLEVANSPDDLSNTDIARIQQEMNTQGLLFQIRVLRTKVSEQKTNAQASQKGANI
ncbi:hypothetical protein H7849_17565 [Alloacidobacterium dinghuense]|uniref:Zinc-finger domain-containing protein n=1 Tax=Alloacidobacterium dinghuense TaxID=2763107 RepID=A0A7G8BED9_9BACT|nr:hypothetical protein [Alloacidobacterium dinghuense]QNI30909.1 hypothetical protein H7849_17565 [Alloacidobacterium dinghuense]